jgi:hypothetical protein
LVTHFARFPLGVESRRKASKKKFGADFHLRTLNQLTLDFNCRPWSHHGQPASFVYDGDVTTSIKLGGLN